MFRRLFLVIAGIALVASVVACGASVDEPASAPAVDYGPSGPPGAAGASGAAGAGSEPAAEPQSSTVVREVIVEREVPVEVIKEVEVLVEVEREVEVMKEVPVEVIAERSVSATAAPQAMASPTSEPVIQFTPAPAPQQAPSGSGQSFPLARPTLAPLPPNIAPPGGPGSPNTPPYDLTFFQHSGVNPFIDTEDDNLSTFAMDVDTASYSVARRFIQDGNLPDPDSVRVEEFVNYFDMGYEPPQRHAFAIDMEASPSPFGADRHWLLRVGLQGREIADWARKDATLIFAIDVSGSMGQENRLGLVKRSLRLLVNQLGPRDEVGIVIYGSRGHVLLYPTDVGESGAIQDAINRLQPGGSTYVEEGLRLAYDMAERSVRPGRITRVILLSDGVGNVGATGSDAILRQIRDEVEQGVTLTTIGFGMGNYNDTLMEQLANDGDGAYYYVDNLDEARTLFVENLTGTIQNIAKDAKVQVEFNPGVVQSYRLLGYENREVADQDFRNDAVDAGEVGAGHSVTALYEVKLHEGSSGSVGTVYLRYEDPDTGRITELSQWLEFSSFAGRFEDASPRFQLAAVVAEYAEVLRGSYWAREGSLDQISKEAWRISRLLRHDSAVSEFAALTEQARNIQYIRTGS